MDKYVKQKKIGEGAFGKAILVRHKQEGKQFVVKEINILKMSPKEREEARKEVAVLAQLKHPNIVKYRESFEEYGSLYICMDFCEKGDLYSKINSQRGLLFAEDQIMDWFVQICLAIKHIHDRKILHRDIKSQNIFLSGDGSVQLGDFGIAKVLNSTVELARTCIGTPYYLSPEICENRPYNNKSDIWSLGCVLYELTTLKHAFEAGNMKNLVLKIIRGSYPPVPPKYSYDLRGLIAQLFKRAPKERPSINSVLRKPFVSKKVGKFLSEQQIQDEFSHTVMHGKKVHRALPPPPVQSRPPSAGGRKPPAARPTPAAPPKYNPAAVYGAPVVRKSKDNRSSVEKKRPGSAGVARPPSAGGVRPSGSSQDLKKKRQEFMEKEKRRREDAEKAALQRKHKDLQEKQKMARINKSKEEGWKNILGSLGSGDGDKQSNGSEPVEEPARRPLPQRPDERNVPLKDRGNYDQYHAYLDKIKQDQADRARRNNPADYLVAPKPGGNSPAPQEWRRAEVGRAPAATPVGVQYQPARGSYVQQAEANRKLAEQAAERAKIVEDYLSRKRQAALNKQRGQAQLFGNAPSYEPPRNVQRYQDADQPRPSSAQSRDREEQEYLDKLRQIRQQNFMDRKGILANQQGLPDPREEAEARKKKIEALRQQADDRARQLKEQLEKQRKDIFNRDKRTPQNQENRIPPRREEVRPSVAAKPVIKPAPAVPITGALRAIGVEAKCVEEPVPAEPAVGVTGALQVIGAVEPKPVEEPAPRIKSPLQQKKEGILKKLNEKGRGKWGAPIKPAVEDKEVEQDSTPESSRSRWGQGGNDQFKQMPLEQTASQMEATSARDKVIQNPSVDSSVADSAKRQWGRPGSTVIKALEGLPVLEGTIASITSDDSVTSPEITSKGGATITISKPPIQKGTIVIKSIDETAVQKQDSSESKEDETSTPGDGEKSGNISDEKITNQNSLQKESHDQKTDQSETSVEKNTNSIPANTSSPNKPALGSRPPLPAKPDVQNKPVMLPKPVLLPKPDKPMQFGNDDKVPTATKSEGEGELFEKVESKVDPSKPAEEDKEEEQEDIVAAVNREIKLGCKTGSGVILGLTTGHFDIGNASMLRTCSEPDLAKLFKTVEAVPLNKLKSGRSLEDIQKLEEEEEEKVRNLLSNVCLDDADEEEDVSGEEASLKLVIKAKDGEEGEDEEENVDEEDEDYEDLLSVRETMQSLLLQDSTDDDSNRASKKISISSLDDDDDDQGDDDDNNDDGDDEEDNDDGEEENDDDKDENGGVKDSQEDKPECDKDGEEDAEEGEEDPEGEDGQDNPSISMSDLFQSDESDADTQFGDEDDDYDLFSRLEESRAGLESELGCDKFLKVYKTVQALQEDEDEKIDEGARLVTELLGPEKEHLYPKIFQLVMADAAFTEELNENKEDSLNSNNT